MGGSLQKLKFQSLLYDLQTAWQIGEHFFQAAQFV